MGNYYLLSVDADQTQIKCYDPEMSHGNEFRTLVVLGKTETEELCCPKEDETDWRQTVLSYIPSEEDRKEPELWMIVGWERLLQNRRVLFTDDLLLVLEQKAMAACTDPSCYSAEAGVNLHRGLELLAPHLLQDYRLGNAWIESFMNPEIADTLRVKFREICGSYISSMWNIEGSVKPALEEWKAGRVGVYEITRNIIKRFENTCSRENVTEQRDKTMVVAKKYFSVLVHELESRVGCPVNLSGEEYIQLNIAYIIEECIRNSSVQIGFSDIISKTLYPFVQRLRDHNRISRFTNTRERQLARVLPEIEQKLKWAKLELIDEDISWALNAVFVKGMRKVYCALEESIVKECSCSCRNNIIESLDPHYGSQIFETSVLYASPRIEREQYLGEKKIFWGKANGISVPEWMDRMETLWTELLRDDEIQNDINKYLLSLFYTPISRCMKDAEKEWELHEMDYVKYGNMPDYCQRNFFFKEYYRNYTTAEVGKEKLIETINRHMPEEFMENGQEEYPYELIWERIRRFNQGRQDILFGPEGIGLPNLHPNEEWCRICDEKEMLLFKEVFEGKNIEELFMESAYSGIRKAILEKMASDDRFTEEHIQSMADRLVYELEEKVTC